MPYAQIIEIAGLSDPQPLQDHLRAWEAEQKGTAPGYLGSRLLVDKDDPGRYLLEVEFASEEEAKRNNDREETSRWAAKLRDLSGGELTYRNLEPVYTTGR